MPADSPGSWAETVSLVTLSFVYVVLFINIFVLPNSFLMSLYLASNMVTTTWRRGPLRTLDDPKRTKWKLSILVQHWTHEILISSHFFLLNST